MKKSKNSNRSATKSAIQAKVMAALQKAFKKPPEADLSCPEPEQVISCALEESTAASQQQVKDHLLTCRNCLELYLDVRLAQSESQSPAGDELEEISPEGPSKAGWLAVLGHKARESFEALGRPKRLFPALAAVSLIILVIILGHEEKSQVLPPRQLARQREVPPSAPPSAAPSQVPTAAKPLPPNSVPGHLAARLQAETKDSSKTKSFSATGALREPIYLEFAVVPNNGFRLSYRASQNAYAYLLRQDQNGNISLLHSSGIEGGKIYYYPAQNHLPESDAATPAATVFLIAAPTPVTDLKVRLKELQRLGKDQMQILFPDATIRSLSVQLP